MANSIARALPQPDQIQAERRDDYMRAAFSYRNARWPKSGRKSSPLERIGIHDNFFRTRRPFADGRASVCLRWSSDSENVCRSRPCSSAPTIAQLAVMLKDDSTPEWSSLVPIQPLGTRPPFFCVHAVGGNVLEYYDHRAAIWAADQPFYAFSVARFGRRADAARVASKTWPLITSKSCASFSLRVLTLSVADRSAA